MSRHPAIAGGSRPLGGRAILVAVALAALSLGSWLYLWRDARAMAAMDADMRMGMASAMRVLPGFAALVLMWTVMMVGMMLPSAAPMIVMFSGLERRNRAAAIAVSHTALFVLGYLVVWTVFSVVAAATQWALHRAALLSPMMAATSPALTGALCLGAGVFQLTPLKRACLRSCRSPIGFLVGQWRPGGAGALVMGLRHGAVCVGCCWALMVLLFWAGVMNLLWVAAIAAFVLAEKLLPGGEQIGRVAGFVLAVLGGLALAKTVF